MTPKSFYLEEELSTKHPLTNLKVNIDNNLGIKFWRSWDENLNIDPMYICCSGIYNYGGLYYLCSYNKLFIHKLLYITTDWNRCNGSETSITNVYS